MRRANNDAILIAKHIHLFLNEYALLQKTRSAHTVKAYSTTLSLYLGFLETEKSITSASLSADCFSVQMIEEWLVWLRENRQCSPETCNNRLASLRAFLFYLGQHEPSMLYLSSGASQIKRRKTQRKKVQGLSKEAVKALLEAPNTSTATGRRDLALLVLMYGTAMRIDEVLSLKMSQLHLDKDKPYVTVIGKGDKIRTLYLLPKAVSHLKRHLDEFHNGTSDTESFVFYSRIGGGKLTQTAISKRLKQYAQIAHQTCPDVPEDIHAHQIRHAKASHWLADGMNLVQISFLLGHAHLETTMVYLDITMEEQTKALATLESEDEGAASKRWRHTDNSLSGFCGVRKMAARTKSD